MPCEALLAVGFKTDGAKTGLENDDVMATGFGGQHAAFAEVATGGQHTLGDTPGGHFPRGGQADALEDTTEGQHTLGDTPGGQTDALGWLVAF
jgi:hypothetical protein